MDKLGWRNDEEILPIINKEPIIYSNKITKINSYGIGQDRELILTNESLYNLSKKKLKRKLNYEQLHGVTLSSVSQEFILHQDGQENDFYYISPDQKIIIYNIAVYYEKKNGKPLKICEVKEKSLKNFTTGKKEKKKDENFSRMDEKFLIDTRTFIIDNDWKEIRNSKVRLSTTTINTEEINNNMTEQPKKTVAKFLFTKNNDEFKYEDIKILKVLGKGNVGKVYLVQIGNNKNYFAMKHVNKRLLSISDGINTLEEVGNLFKKIDHPFLINIEYFFDTDENLHFISPFINGEELYYYMKNNKNFDEKKIQFYAGIIILALGFLHIKGFDYKDISPRNIIIGLDGYLKLIPFHISKIIPLKKENISNQKLLNEKNEYSSPEIMNDENISDIKGKQAADWWSLGVIIFEMIYSIPPFFSENKEKLKNEIINTNLKFPKEPKISENLKDLVTKLLDKKYESRLGYNKGVEEIKNHSFFKDLDFNALKEKKIPSPYKPVETDVLKRKKISYIERYTYEDLEKSGIKVNQN